jgi:CMP-N,N'-diacetyllegionaminic acid synthase
VQIACVIPARANSKRIDKKNTRPLGGKSLMLWSIEAALESNVFTAGVWVSSDSDEILGIASGAGAEIIRRPPELAEDHVSSHAALTHAVEFVDTCPGGLDYVCLQQPTSPFVTARTFAAMTHAMQQTEWPGVCGAVEVPHKQHMLSFDQEPLVMRAILGEHSDPRIHLPTEPLLVARVCPYIMRVEFAMRDLPITSVRNLQGFRLGLIEGFDIDTIEEWNLGEVIAEYLTSRTLSIA